MREPKQKAACSVSTEQQTCYTVTEGLSASRVMYQIMYKMISSSSKGDAHAM